jgi:hypothetical protein
MAPRIVESSSPFPYWRTGSTPVPATTPARVSSPKTAKTPKVDSLPRSRSETPAATIGRNSGAVSAVVLGAQAFGCFVGLPVVAHAADATPVDPAALPTAAASIAGSELSPEALAEARRALWSTFVASGGSDVVEMLPAVQAQDATQVAAELVSKDAADGKLTAAELTTIEQKLTDTFGEESAKQALLRAFPAAFDKLDSEAAAHLLQRYAAVETHVERFQSIVDEMLDGKNKLIDSDFDGKLGAGDLVFTQDSEGKVSVAKIGQKVADEATVAKAIVDASHKMSSAGVSFALIKDHKANPDFWNVGPGGILTLKDGAKPSDAVVDIVNNGGKYGFECATGLVAVYYEAMLDLLGPQDFDRVAADIRLGPWQMEDDLERLYTHSSPKPGWAETDLGEYKLTPGNYYYFRNWDVTDDARARGWQGENVIYLGGGKFYGHGIGLGDGQMFIDKLAGEMKPGGKTPSLLNLEARLATDVLKLDLAPGK